MDRAVVQGRCRTSRNTLNAHRYNSYLHIRRVRNTKYSSVVDSLQCFAISQSFLQWAKLNILLWLISSLLPRGIKKYFKIV